MVCRVSDKLTLFRRGAAFANLFEQPVVACSARGNMNEGSIALVRDLPQGAYCFTIVAESHGGDGDGF